MGNSCDITTLSVLSKVTTASRHRNSGRHAHQMSYPKVSQLYMEEDPGWGPVTALSAV